MTEARGNAPRQPKEKQMTNEIKITIENANEFGAGTKVEFNFGAYSATVEGTVTRVEIMPASKFFPAEARLWAEYEAEDGEIVETTITRFSDVGIGTRLVEAVASPAKASRWAA